MKKYLIAIIIIVVLIIMVILGLNQNQKVEINKEATLEDISFNDDKINMYFFYGSGCAHCKALFAFLDEHYDEVSKYCNVYAFEVWKNEENATIMAAFSDFFGDNVGSSVPYYIIGDESFSGFSTSMGDKLLNTMKEKYEEKENINNLEEIINNLKETLY